LSNPGDYATLNSHQPRDGTADDDAKVSFQIERVATDSKTGKPVADITRYSYRDGDTRYVVTFERQKTILQTVFREEMPRIKRLLAKIVGFDGAYQRFTGKVTIEKFEKDVRVEIFDDHAIWELMYFGKARGNGGYTLSTTGRVS
jgi:hypothetical protein